MLSGNDESLLCPRSRVLRFLRRAIFGDMVVSALSAKISVSIPRLSHSSSGTVPSCCFQRFTSFGFFADSVLLFIVLYCSGIRWSRLLRRDVRHRWHSSGDASPRQRSYRQVLRARQRGQETEPAHPAA